MRPLLPIALAGLLGCPPPPAVDLGDTGVGAEQEPSIAVIYPPQGSTVELEEDCTLSMLVVTRIDHIDLVDPATAEAVVEGEGHWHLEVGDTYYSSYQEFLQVEQMEISPQTKIFGVALHNSLHQPISGSASQTNLEVQIVAPAGVSCE